MELKLKTGVQGHVYFPRCIRELFGENLRAIPNTKALVIFGEGTSPEDVIASLRVIISDLKLREQDFELSQKRQEAKAVE